MHRHGVVTFERPPDVLDTLAPVQGRLRQAYSDGRVGGRGGGKPNFASGSGSDVTKVDEAIAAAQEWFLAK